VDGLSPLDYPSVQLNFIKLSVGFGIESRPTTGNQIVQSENPLIGQVAIIA
jgi:hypothetical protein